MPAFRFSSVPIDAGRERDALADPCCGGYASFEGWVRDHNDGRRVLRLDYEAYEALALREGERIVREALQRFGVNNAACVHRTGELALGEMAVWVGVAAAHRAEAFAACRWIIDEIKHRLPIWKKEHYVDGDSGWVNCERCATAVDADGLHDRGDHVHERHAHRSGTVAFVHDYSRQVALREVGEAGQARLRGSSVLVIGAGGLGVPVLQALATAGIGRITVVDVPDPRNPAPRQAPARRDYDARELTVAAGERVECLETVGGWHLCRAADGRVGWVPVSHAE